jgi:hypothetical protein
MRDHVALKKIKRIVGWCSTINSALKKMRQEDCEFACSLNYTETPYLKRKERWKGRNKGREGGKERGR